MINVRLIRKNKMLRQKQKHKQKMSEEYFYAAK